MLEEVAFISFLSLYILYGLIIILWLTDESQELGQTFLVYYTTTYSGLTKVNDFIRSAKLLILHKLSIHLYLYVYLFVEGTLPKNFCHG